MSRTLLFAIGLLLPVPASADIFYSCGAPGVEVENYMVDSEKQAFSRYDNAGALVGICSYAQSQFGSALKSCSVAVAADDSATARIIGSRNGTDAVVELRLDRARKRLTAKGNGESIQDVGCTLSLGTRALEQLSITPEPAPNAGTKVVVTNQSRYPLRCDIKVTATSDTLGTQRKVTQSTVLTVSARGSNEQSWSNMAAGTAQVESSCELD